MEVQTTPPAQTPPPPAPPASAPPPAQAAAAPAPTPTPAPAEVKQEVPASAPEPKSAAAPEVKPPAPEAKAEPAKPEKVAEKPKPAEVEIKLPEGANLDPAALGKFKAIMGDETLTPSQRAQAVIDLERSNAADQRKAFEAKVQQMRAADIDALKKDADFGGPKYEQTVQQSQSAAKQFFGEDGAKLLREAGLDNHPALVKGLARIRQAIAEDDTGSRVPNEGTAPKVDAKPRTLVQRGAGVYSDPKVQTGRNKK